MIRLAAIDDGCVPSYFRPAKADREGTLSRLKSQRRNLIDPKRNLIDPKFALCKGHTITGAVQATPLAAS